MNQTTRDKAVRLLDFAPSASHWANCRYKEAWALHKANQVQAVKTATQAILATLREAFLS